ncbi:VOC family protein [Mumia sp. zg.B21]|uniref:VOC family protein n=1 Tax=unclassified Mumia TaxID=2621872 RepID=UPI001C6E0804|nr:MULTISPECIES: VOC family protein [unclassified Mumia]MBW9211295.1 VOC family protein [Mumia sp. zg.B21]MDD9348576.1 VOC family protein [Mumia sp.]
MVTLQAATFDAHDPTRLARFWAQLLERDVVDEVDAALLPGEDGQLGLRFAPSPTVTTGPRRMHLHLTSADSDDQRATVAKALSLGGAHLDVGQRPEEGHIVLADPEGNALCVIEPDNAYLAGCGFLGELACEGTRAVGAFWSEALGWPLVWDQDEETAIQSLGGGTKVAWGGPPVTAETRPHRQRLDLLAAPGLQEREIDRLVALGATRLEAGRDGVVVMADPDGNEFWVRAG